MSELPREKVARLEDAPADLGEKDSEEGELRRLNLKNTIILTGKDKTRTNNHLPSTQDQNSQANLLDVNNHLGTRKHDEHALPTIKICLIILLIILRIVLDQPSVTTIRGPTIKINDNLQDTNEVSKHNSYLDWER